MSQALQRVHPLSSRVRLLARAAVENLPNAIQRDRGQRPRRTGGEAGRVRSTGENVCH
jgi:hypothetical protein